MKTEPIVVINKLSKRNREWMQDEFFKRAPTKGALVYLAEHYRDIAETNKVASQDDRAEFSRRARYLKRLAAGM